MFNDFLRLFFPRLCVICSNALIQSERLICTLCRYRLPKTGSHLESGPAIAKLFWGRVDIENAFSYFRFEKGNSVQQLIYQLKYKGVREIGQLAGEWMGQELKDHGLPASVDLIVPIPLHALKKRKRGYNQCDYFARGLGGVLGLPVEVNNLVRRSHSSSQTHKIRYDRWKNVSDVFLVKRPALFAHKHILLVDDVVTTGATLEAASLRLLAIPGTKVSIATIAIAG